MIFKISHIFFIICLLGISGCDSQSQDNNPGKVMIDKQLQALQKAKALKAQIADIEKKKQDQME
ncbi:MAG: hypothetical protein Q9M28_04825 [Mariprofundaceae bacterium]|nr:hypothetical protein [Mariprofundaceae bacterium]